MKIRVQLRDPSHLSDKDLIDEIEDIFGDYHIPFDQYFIYEDEDNTSAKWPLTVNGQLNKEALEIAAYILGFDSDAFDDIDHYDTLKWHKKYRYFDYIKEFDAACVNANYHKNDPIKVMRLFSYLLNIPDEELSTRYDKHDIYNRMIQTLKDIDRYIPGTFHKDAKMLNVSFVTNHLCHYKNIKLLVLSFFELIDSFKFLFFEGLERELTEDEINEFNFLVSVLGIQDKYYHLFGIPELRYREFRIYKNTYKQIGSSDLFDYIKLTNNRIPEFWKCAELSEDKKLLQKLSDLDRTLKSSMRRFTQLLSNFEFSFIWSDTGFQKYTDEELMEDREISELLGEEPLTESDLKKKWTTVYVKKNSEEMQGDDKYIQLMTELCSPEKMGGLRVKEYDFDMSEAMRRISNLHDEEKRIQEEHHA